MAVEVPGLTFSGNEHSRTSSALDTDIELKSFTDVGIDERTESKATKSKIKADKLQFGSDFNFGCLCYIWQ